MLLDASEDVGKIQNEHMQWRMFECSKKMLAQSLNVVDIRFQIAERRGSASVVLEFARAIQ